MDQRAAFAAGDDSSENEACVDCDREREKYGGRSALEGIADVVRAVTPLGFAGMGIYGGIRALEMQSADYQAYARMMAASGMPLAQNVNGYSGLLGSYLGGGSLLAPPGMLNGGGNGGSGPWGAPGPSLPWGYPYPAAWPSDGYPWGAWVPPVGPPAPAGFGAGYPAMYPATPWGYPGQAFPYANAYAGLPAWNGFGGLSAYNPWLSAYDSQLNAGGLPSLYSAQLQATYRLRWSQQNLSLEQDLWAAQKARWETQIRYEQATANLRDSYGFTCRPAGYPGYGGSNRQ